MRVSGLLKAFALSVLAAAEAWPPVPSVNSSVVQEHVRATSRLIALERTQRQDEPFRQNLSSVAMRADAIVHAMRQDEIVNFWRSSSNPELGVDESFAGQAFPLTRPRISQTQLWRVVKRMPKGALLHAHLAAMLPFRIIIETILETEGMAISATHSLADDQGRKNAYITFSHHKSLLHLEPAINSASYVPNTPVPVTTAAEGFPGGREGFIEYIKSKLVLPPEESIHHELGVDEVWRRFATLFGKAGSLLSYEPVVRTFYQQLFRQLVDDGISWVEIRAKGTVGKLAHTGEEVLDPDLDFWWEVMEDELAKFTAAEKRFWGARVIWSDSRGQSKESLHKNMQIALDRKVKFPELFSGYDLVGQEDLGRTLADAAPELLWLQEQANRLNVSVPFFFHAGEALGDGNSTDLNMFDALAFKTRRIGHGFALYKHPELMRRVVGDDVMVEVCPISNEVLRLATDILHHPLPAMIAHGVPTAISNDDPAMLGQDAAGLSYDFYQVIQGFDNVGLAGLGALAHNSLRWSQFEDQSHDDWIQGIRLAHDGKGTKAWRINEWNRQWEEFCQWIVDEFGSKYGQ